MNVLVIEDEKFILESMAKALRAEGYNVVTAEDQHAALEHIRSIKLDLIITDVMLPYAGGFDIVDYIRQDPDNKHLPIILVTGMDKDVLKTTRTSANVCLTKPFKSTQLTALVNLFIGEPSGEVN